MGAAHQQPAFVQHGEHDQVPREPGLSSEGNADVRWEAETHTADSKTMAGNPFLT